MQSNRAESDQRYLAICAFLWQQQQPLPLPFASAAAAPGLPLVFVVAAASDASLTLLCCDLATCQRQLGAGHRLPQWAAAADLQHHACPVLCTAHCCLEEPASSGSGRSAGTSSSHSSRQRHVVCSGATDGTVAVWDVTPAAAAAAAAAAAGASFHGSCKPLGEHQRAAAVTPLLVLEGLHQSGVNSMAAVPAGEFL